MSATFIPAWRMTLVAVAFVAAFSVTLARLYYLHLPGREELRAFAEQSRRLTIPESARRGDIFDSRGNLLATTRPRIRLGIDPTAFEEKDLAAFRELCRELNLPVESTVENVQVAARPSENPRR